MFSIYQHIMDKKNLSNLYDDIMVILRVKLIKKNEWNLCL